MIPIMEEAAAIDWPGWIQAIVVSCALIFTGIQFILDRRDRAAEAERQKQAALDEAIRHQGHIQDRRRERLIAGYAHFCDGAIEFLSRHAEATEVGKLADKQDEEFAKDPANERKYDGALRVREGVMRLREQAKMGMSKAMASHLALRFDEDAKSVIELDAAWECQKNGVNGTARAGSSDPVGRPSDDEAEAR